MTPIFALSALAALASCGPAQAPVQSSAAVAAPAKVVTSAPAGAYAIDKAHTSVLFRVSHLGLSHYTARFTGVDAQMQFDPANPEGQSVEAKIDARTIQTDFPFDTPDFDKQLQDSKWLNAAKFPEMTFKSTRIQQTAPNEADVTGDLTLRGITHPVTLHVIFNGGYGGNPNDPAGARLGFSAAGKLKRSDYGVSFGIPQPGSNMGVSDDVEIIIETEFTKAPAPPSSAAP